MGLHHNLHLIWRHPLVVRRVSTTTLAMALVLATAVGTGAQEPADNETPISVEHAGFLTIKGRATFRVFCASCHGPKANGKGNIAQYLTVKATDLTQISRTHDGKFPMELIDQVIAGPEKVRGHGNREMPIWGDVFQNPLARDTPQDETPEERAQRKIRELTAYLESIQE